MFLPLSVCLTVCPLYYSKNYERVLMKFFEEVVGGPRTNRLDFLAILDHDPYPGFLEFLERFFISLYLLLRFL